MKFISSPVPSENSHRRIEKAVFMACEPILVNNLMMKIKKNDYSWHRGLGMAMMIHKCQKSQFAALIYWSSLKKSGNFNDLHDWQSEESR